MTVLPVVVHTISALLLVPSHPLRAYFSAPLLVAFGLMLFIGGATIGLLSFATLKMHKPQLVQSLCDERVTVCQ